MKKLLLGLSMVLFVNVLVAQIIPFPEPESYSAMSIGFLNGGGGLLGADLEILLNDRVGIQLGAGFVSYGAAINYHLKPGIRTSFVSLQYLNQGTGQNFVQNAIGPSLGYRGKRWFTYQLGLAKTLSKGPAFPIDRQQPAVMFTYSIGAYFAL